MTTGLRQEVAAAALPQVQHEEEEMCTPGDMPPLCQCAHDTAARLLLVVKVAVVAVLAGCVVWVVGAVPGWVLLLAGWLLVMGVAAVVSVARDRRALGPPRAVEAPEAAAVTVLPSGYIGRKSHADTPVAQAAPQLLQ